MILVPKQNVLRSGLTGAALATALTATPAAAQFGGLLGAEASYATPVGAGDVAFLGPAETDDGCKTTDRYLASSRYRFAF